ncbi:hypothetical protein U9M48_008353 [Paspalum notatum var. saurae]|uniref:Reverse transcriptase n=1 Tax=Paspalum notatum var. saurae TaxID=547442 RepID=A0AAQ3WDB4_PASNO
MMNPVSLEVAMNLAHSYERREQVVAASQPPSSRSFRRSNGILPTPSGPPLLLAPSQRPDVSSAASAPARSSTSTGRTVRRLSPDEMEDRRRQGLCFNCDEPYSRGHNRVCKDLPRARRANHLPTRHCRLLVVLGATTVAALIDSGSTHNFISESAAAKTGLAFAPWAGMRVAVANGEHLPCVGVIQQASFSVHSAPFTTDIFVLPLAGFDMVLGTQWLATLGPILWDFSNLTMVFWRHNGKVEWHVLTGTPPSRLLVSTGDDVLAALLSAFDDLFAEPRGLPPARDYDHRIHLLPGTTPVAVRPYQYLALHKDELEHQYRDMEQRGVDDLFAEPRGLPPARDCDHRIHLLPGTTPVAVRPYRYLALHKDELERQYRDMEQRGLIRRSTSAFSSPVLLVKKADGTWRFCVDYRALNERTVKDSFPIPVVDELLDELRGARFFTKLDLRSGYHQVRMAPDDVHKTAFRTHEGLYEFLVMPFGLSNAPATFQALMNAVVRPFLRRFVLVFFDDILIYSHTWSEHLHHLRAVFSALRDNNLVLKRSKCSFGLPSVSYLGHVVLAEGVAMDATKVQAVVDWPTPRSVRALRGFLALAGYYRKFVQGYGEIAGPLNDLLKKNGFSWSIQQLKQALTTAPILTLPDFQKPFILECDASGTGCGAVLHQGAGPVAFFSRAFAPRHYGLAAYECELIGLVQAVRHWRPYLWGRAFLIKTDHYSLKVEYRPRRSNVVADALSRRDADDTALFAVTGPAFDVFDDLRQAANSHPELVALRDQILDGSKREPWSVIDGVVLFKGRTYLPADSPILQAVLTATHDVGHEGAEKTLHRFRRDFHTPRARAIIQDMVRHCIVCQRNKTEHLHPAGLLMPLPVPTSVWSDFFMDFVEGLPKVGGKSVILTVVDRFSKYAHFIALRHPYSAETVAAVFFSEIVRLHGLPTSIVSDRDPVFTSTFWSTLFKLLGIKLHMSSAFHPQSNGQTEAVNKMIGMYLRCLTGDRPRQWLRWLPWAEFVYNTSYHNALRDTPFRVVYGREPPAIREYDVGDCRGPAVAQTMTERAEFLADWPSAHMIEAHRALSFAQGDWVWLRIRHRVPASIPTTARGKLRPRYYGPYKIAAVINDVAYRLELPVGARIHDVFHVGLLKKFVGEPPGAPPPLPPLHYGAVQPQPVKAIKSRVARGVHQILVQWESLPSSAATWEDVEVFQKRYPLFQLEDELFAEGGRDVMWGRFYRRRRGSRDSQGGGQG